MIPAPIFIGGAGRSGTTLLRAMLDSHPSIACGSELKVTTAIAKLWLDCQTGFQDALTALHLPPPEVTKILADTILAFMAPSQAASGKPRLAEKTPGNVLWFGPLHQMFPESPLVHVIRDGRDVVASLLRMDWSGPDGRPIPYTQDARAAASYWVTSVRAGREVAAIDPRLRSRYIEVRYEELVADPEGQMRLLLDFIGEPWDDAVLRHHDFERDLAGESSAEQVKQPVYKSAIGRWQRVLSDDDLKAVRAVAGGLLAELGYEAKVASNPPPIKHPREAELVAHYEAHLDYSSPAQPDVLVPVLRALDVDLGRVRHALDLGCGDGRAALWLAQEHSVEVAGVDFSPGRIEMARAASESAGLETCSFVCQDLHYFLEAPGQRFDLIAAFEILEHLEDPEGVIESCVERLRSGGSVVGSVPLNMPYVAHLQVFPDVEDVVRRLKPIQVVRVGDTLFCRWGREGEE